MSKLYDLLSAMCGKIKKPDWNQNDSTAPDYVKNRPFYTCDPVETVLVEESTAEFDDVGNGIYVAIIPSTFSPAAGETYKVSWDGTVYECTCVDYYVPAIGNLSIEDDYPDTGEPFVIYVSDDDIEIRTKDSSASHTISVSGIVAPIVKIPAKYLPIASETEPGIVSVAYLLKRVKNEYFEGSDTEVIGYINASLIEKYAAKNNSYGIFSSGKFGGAVLSCYHNYVDKYITCVLSGGAKIECWKFSEGSTAMEQLWGISEDGVVISSSTPDSTKKFRITVDDSGTLTATEVTE